MRVRFISVATRDRRFAVANASAPLKFDRALVLIRHRDVWGVIASQHPEGSFPCAWPVRPAVYRELLGDCDPTRWGRPKGRTYLLPSRRTDATFSSQIRPRFMSFAVNGASGFSGLRWRFWGSQVAEARGVYYFRDCRPYCAAGKNREYPVELLAIGLRRRQRLGYTYLVVRILTGRPRWHAISLTRGRTG